VPPNLAGRATDAPLEQMSDALLQDVVGWQPDRIPEAFGLQELVDLRVREGGVGAEVAAHLPSPLTRDHGFEHILPNFCRIDIARTQYAALEIAELVGMSRAEMRHALWPFTTADENSSEIAKILAATEMWGYVALDEADAAAGFAEVALRRYANGCEESPVPFLEGIWVLPAFRRRDVGQHLIARISAALRTKGFKELCSDALLDNTASHEAHRTWGFAETERVVYFRKPLA
jgi:aminoglycoside 6'-N-acetyltransferase I